jgi:hypothetical protein
VPKDPERVPTGLARRVEVFLDLAVFNEVRRIAIADETTISKILTQIVLEHFREKGIPQRAHEAPRPRPGPPQGQSPGAGGQARPPRGPDQGSGQGQMGQQGQGAGQPPGMRRRRRRRRGPRGPGSPGSAPGAGPQGGGGSPPS